MIKITFWTSTSTRNSQTPKIELILLVRVHILKLIGSSHLKLMISQVENIKSKITCLQTHKYGTGRFHNAPTITLAIPTPFLDNRRHPPLHQLRFNKSSHQKEIRIRKKNKLRNKIKLRLRKSMIKLETSQVLRSQCNR